MARKFKKFVFDSGRNLLGSLRSLRRLRVAYVVLLDTRKVFACIPRTVRRQFRAEPRSHKEAVQRVNELQITFAAKQIHQRQI